MTILLQKPSKAIPLFSTAPKAAKAIGPPSFSMAQDYIRSIDERSYEQAGGYCTVIQRASCLGAALAADSSGLLGCLDESVGLLG